MKKRKIVLVDSYWYRFYVKEKIFGQSSLEILETLFKLPKPVKVFYIDITPEEAYQRSGGKFTKYESFNKTKEGFIKFQKILDKELRKLLEDLDLDIVYLDGEKEISVNAKIILKIIKNETAR